MKLNFKHILMMCIVQFSVFCFAQVNTTLSQGETLFKENNAADAVEVLEYEILSGQISENSYNFLGLGYYQIGDYEKSIDAFKRGLKVQPENAKLLNYNLGNTYYALKNYIDAIECYSNAVRADPKFYDAILNRANALLMADRLLSAKEDYQDYIEKCPDDAQKERIELLIKALEDELARREEEARLLAEQNKARWEEYDGNLTDKKNDSYKADWEEVEGQLSQKDEKDHPEWEKIRDDHDKELYENEDELIVENDSNWESFDKEEAPVYEEKVKTKKDDNWEAFDHGDDEKLAKTDEELYEKIDDSEEWESLSADEMDELKKLEEESRKEREKWLSDKKKREEEEAEYQLELKKRQQQQSLEDERRMREQLLEDMMKAEDERRKKLLEDVANSLQNTDSTNLTSGAEDLLDYDLEGELD